MTEQQKQAMLRFHKKMRKAFLKYGNQTEQARQAEQQQKKLESNVSTK